MNLHTYWGTAPVIFNHDISTTGVTLRQSVSGECAATCGRCAHLLHSGTSVERWFCSDPVCGERYTAAGAPASSLFPGFFFEKPDALAKFSAWVTIWTGRDDIRIDIHLDE